MEKNFIEFMQYMHCIGPNTMLLIILSSTLSRLLSMDEYIINCYMESLAKYCNWSD